MDTSYSTESSMEEEYDNSGRVENAPQLIDDYISDAVDYRNQVAELADFDQSYGPNKRNRMDIFWPGKDRDVPITMFIHGGYWQRLDRSAFSHLAKGLNAHGVAVAMPSYTLCPETSISGIIDEMRRACITLWKTYRRPITVFGHSAGGHLAACMLASKWNLIHHTLPEDLVMSALSISGVFELAPLIGTSHNVALKLNAEQAHQASPCNWIIEPGQRFDAWVGSEESGEFIRQSHSQAERWHMMGAVTKFQKIDNANHFTAVDQLTDPQSPMVKRLLELIVPKAAPTLADLPEINLATMSHAPDNSAVSEDAYAKSNTGDELQEQSTDKAELPTGEISETPAVAKDQPGDDLTLIKGIGKVLQVRLNDLGITTFARIAALGEAEITSIDKTLNFKGRIARDKWLEQAKDLLKTSEPVE